MRSYQHSGRFDPLWLAPAGGTDGAELFVAPDALPPSAAGVSASDAVGRDFDEALEQIGAEGCRVCPLCGAVGARDGSATV